MADSTKSTNRRRVVITGAGLGIGQGIAIELARAGYDVAVHYSSSREGADQTVAECEALGARAIAIGGNLREVETCFRVVEEAADFLGGIDALVNNCGVTRAVSFFETGKELFDEQFEINIRSYFFCAQRAARFMDEQGGGAILNISSVHAYANVRFCGTLTAQQDMPDNVIDLSNVPLLQIEASEAMVFPAQRRIRSRPDPTTPTSSSRTSPVRTGFTRTSGRNWTAACMGL